MKVLDINCDMGESFGNWNMGDDVQVMKLITTANVACGFHAGDPITMMNTVSLAHENGVAVGAHPGLPDLLGFGRRVMSITSDDAYSYVVYQVGALQAFLNAQGMELNHIKPHGAMFHLMRDPANSKSALDALMDIAPTTAIYWPGPIGKEPITTAAVERGVTVITEVYPDLNYTGDGSLIVERKKLPVEASVIYDRVSQVLADKELTTSEGNKVPMDVQSVCIHGDGPNAIEVLEAVHKAAKDAGVEVACATQ